MRVIYSRETATHDTHSDSPFFPSNPSHLAADNTKKSTAIFVLLLKGNQSAQSRAATRRHSPPPSLPSSLLPVEQSPIIFSRSAAGRICDHISQIDRSIASVRSLIRPTIHSFVLRPRAAFQPFSVFTRDMLSTTSNAQTTGGSKRTVYSFDVQLALVIFAQAQRETYSFRSRL